MQSRQKIRIKKKKIVIPVRKLSKRDRLYAFFKKNEKKLSVVFTFLGLLVISLYVMSLKSDMPPTTNFPYPEILPQEMQYRNCEQQFVNSKTSLGDFLRGKIADKHIHEIAYLAKEKQFTTVKRNDTLYAFLPEDKNTAAVSSLVYQIAVDSFAIISTSPNTSVTIRTLPLTTLPKRISGKINESLLDAIPEKSRLLSKRLSKNTEFQTILNTQSVLDIADIKVNDEFNLIYEEKWHKDKLVAAGNILALHYKRDDKAFYAFRYNNDKGQINYFDENGNTAKRRFLPYPLQHSIITSPFGDRLHPIEKRHKPHHGTDYRAKLDESVYAVGDGTVIRAGFTKDSGNYVKLQHSDGYTSQYLHFNSIAKGIKIGTKVKQGDIIGLAGKTGEKATGVHVCFRVKKYDKPIDHTKDSAFGESKIIKVRDLNGFEQHRDSLRLMLEK